MVHSSNIKDVLLYPSDNVITRREESKFAIQINTMAAH